MGSQVKLILSEVLSFAGPLEHKLYNTELPRLSVYSPLATTQSILLGLYIALSPGVHHGFFPKLAFLKKQEQQYSGYTITDYYEVLNNF